MRRVGDRGHHGCRQRRQIRRDLAHFEAMMLADMVKGLRVNADHRHLGDQRRWRDKERFIVAHFLLFAARARMNGVLSGPRSDSYCLSTSSITIERSFRAEALIVM